MLSFVVSELSTVVDTFKKHVSTEQGARQQQPNLTASAVVIN